MHYKRACLDEDYARDSGVVVASLYHVIRRPRFDSRLFQTFGFSVYFLERTLQLVEQPASLFTHGRRDSSDEGSSSVGRSGFMDRGFGRTSRKPQEWQRNSWIRIRTPEVRLATLDALEGVVEWGHSSLAGGRCKGRTRDGNNWSGIETRRITREPVWMRTTQGTVV